MTSRDAILFKTFDSSNASIVPDPLGPAPFALHCAFEGRSPGVPSGAYRQSVECRLLVVAVPEGQLDAVKAASTVGSFKACAQGGAGVSSKL